MISGSHFLPIRLYLALPALRCCARAAHCMLRCFSFAHLPLSFSRAPPPLRACAPLIAHASLATCAKALRARTHACSVRKTHHAPACARWRVAHACHLFLCLFTTPSHPLFRAFCFARAHATPLCISYLNNAHACLPPTFLLPARALRARSF